MIHEYRGTWTLQWVLQIRMGELKSAELLLKENGEVKTYQKGRKLAAELLCIHLIVL